MKSKLDIFKLLRSISRGDKDFIDSLTEEELKDFSPYVVNMWLSNPADLINERTLYTNAMVNPHIFGLAKHKKLLYKLMCISQGFGDTRYTFPKKMAGSTMKSSVDLIMEWYKVRKEVAELYLKSLVKTDIIEMAEQLGYDKDVTKKVENEWLKRTK